MIYYEYAGDSVRHDVFVSSGDMGSHNLSIQMTYMFTTVVEPPEVTLSGSGSRVAGTSYTLTCTVTPPTGVQFSDPPNVQWLWPDTRLLTPMNPSQISSDVYVSNITLNPLQETHSGQYSCSASYSLGGVSSEVVTEEMNITIKCELKCI